MKKLIAAILLLIAAFIFVSCGETTPDEKADSETESEATHPRVSLSQSEISLGNSITITLNSESDYDVFVSILGAGIDQTVELTAENTEIQIIPTQIGSLIITAYCTEINFSVSFIVDVLSVGSQDDPVNPETPSAFEPDILIITDTSAYLSDGSTLNEIVDGLAKYAGHRLLIVGSDLIEYDATGDGQIKYTFGSEPVQVLDNGSIYHCLETDPDTALALGAQAKWYSEFFKDDVSLDFWYMNQMRCTDLVSANDIVWNIDENGSLKLIDGVASGVEHIHEPDFYIHSLDIVNKRISFNDQVPQDYTFNYILNAKQWQEFGGLFYSENGYTWSEAAGLSEAVNSLDDWNAAPFPVALPMAQYPTLIAAGVNDGLLFWIEANTGWLMSFNPGADEFLQVYRIYEGDGMTATGESKDLQPVMVWPYLYYFDGGWFQLDMEAGFTSLFYAGSAEIRKW